MIFLVTPDNGRIRLYKLSVSCRLGIKKGTEPLFCAFFFVFTRVNRPGGRRDILGAEAISMAFV